MHWTSWSEFLAMGGYGAYVWAAYLVTLSALAGEMVSLALRRRNVLRFLQDLVEEEGRDSAGEPYA